MAGTKNILEQGQLFIQIALYIYIKLQITIYNFFYLNRNTIYSLNLINIKLFYISKNHERIWNCMNFIITLI